MNVSVNGLSGLVGFLFGLWPKLAPTLIVIFMIIQLVVIVYLANAVRLDARKKQHDAPGIFLIPPWMWCVVVLFTGGYLGALAYWFIHYSAQRYQPAKS